jgi:hypothetical protein
MKKTRNALGVCWQYRNSPARGITWAAEVRVGNALLCVYGQKNMKSSTVLAEKYAKRLGWMLVEPWRTESNGKRYNKRRRIK